MTMHEKHLNKIDLAVTCLLPNIIFLLYRLIRILKDRYTLWSRAFTTLTQSLPQLWPIKRRLRWIWKRQQRADPWT